VVGKLAVGTYKSVRFKVGLPSAVNSSIPSDSPDSVSLNHPEMWFGSTAQPDGYCFLHVSGEIDTSSTLSGNMTPFQFRIGTNSNYEQVIMPLEYFTVVENQVVFSHIIIDYSKLFSGIGLNDPANLSILDPSDNSTLPGQTVSNNIPLMFRYE